MSRSRKKILGNALVTLCLVFVLMNVVAAIHAYKFTHFSLNGKRNEELGSGVAERAALLFTGVDNPRPVNTVRPDRLYEVFYVRSNVRLEGWKIAGSGPSKGAVLLFHGYTSNKSSLLGRANVFLKAGYDCYVVDFMGSGGSGGMQTTIGYLEAEEVKDCYTYVKRGGGPVYLYGASMGAAAILKAIHDYDVKPDAVILDCPFRTMYDAVLARFEMLHVPAFPMAGLLVFWGGAENGFNGFRFEPVKDARSVRCPVLLEWGELDDRVAKSETDAIYQNLGGPKTLKIYAHAGHDDYEVCCGVAWEAAIHDFLDGLPYRGNR